MIKYKAAFEKVEEVEIESETKCFVTFRSGRKDKKLTSYHAYFSTKEEAVAHLVHTAKNKVGDAEGRLHFAEKYLSDSKAELDKLIECWSV